MIVKGNSVVHKITLKRPTTYHNVRLDSVEYAFDKTNDVIQISESLQGPILTNLFSLDIDTRGSTVSWVVSEIIRLLLKLKHFHIAFKDSNHINFGKHFCLFMGMIVKPQHGGLAFECLEKFSLIRTKTPKKNLNVFKKIITAFLFERISTRRKDQPIVCGPGCKLKKFRAKFSRFDYVPIHRLVCFEETTSEAYPEIDQLF